MSVDALRNSHEDADSLASFSRRSPGLHQSQTVIRNTNNGSSAEGSQTLVDGKRSDSDDASVDGNSSDTIITITHRTETGSNSSHNRDTIRVSTLSERVKDDSTTNSLVVTTHSDIHDKNTESHTRTKASKIADPTETFAIPQIGDHDGAADGIHGGGVQTAPGDRRIYRRPHQHAKEQLQRLAHGQQKGPGDRRFVHVWCVA